MSLREAQDAVDAWISQFEEGYWPPLSNLARLTEEVGELAREMNHRFGHKPKRPEEPAEDLALELADVTYLVDRAVNELSGGERQRVLIARSLATETEIILLDEPTSNLDIDHSLEILTLLRRLADSGKSVVVALHDLNAVMRFSDRVIVLDDGHVSACGDPAEILGEETVESVFSVRLERLTGEDGSSVLVFHRRDGGV